MKLKILNASTKEFQKLSNYVLIFGTTCAITLPFTMYLMDKTANEKMEDGVIEDIRRVTGKGKSFNEIPRKMKTEQ